MKEQLIVQRLLHEKLAEYQGQNPRYSMRAFSKRLGIHSGALSSILSGKRNVSKKLAIKIAEKLLLDPQEKSELLYPFPEKRTPTKSVADKNSFSEYRKLSAAQFKIVAEWEHFAILSLLRTKNFKNDPKWIAARIGVTVTKATDSLNRLIEVGMVEKSPDGKLKRTAAKFKTSDDIADVGLKKSHAQTLDLAKTSLFKDDVKIRDHTWSTLAIRPDKISEAKEMIRKFQTDFAKVVESDDSTEVYRLSMHFFPLTQMETL